MAVPDEAFLQDAEARLAEASGSHWRFVDSGDGRVRVEVVFLDGNRSEMRVMRDLSPASDADLRFVGHCRTDLARLVAAVRARSSLPPDELDGIESRCALASPAPWTTFLESDGGKGGCDVIRVSERDEEPDMYLWFGSELAPSPDFRLAAIARQLIPALLAVVRG